MIQTLCDNFSAQRTIQRVRGKVEVLRKKASFFLQKKKSKSWKSMEVHGLERAMVHGEPLRHEEAKRNSSYLLQHERQTCKQLN